jgi:hypothetical protein
MHQSGIQLVNNFSHPAIWTVIIGCIFAAPALQAAEPTLCEDSEIPVFSCMLKNSKTVSICASASPARGHVDYRFGTKSNVELHYSANVDRPGNTFHRGEVVYANNSDEMIWFTNGKYRYSVYSPIRGVPGLIVWLHGNAVVRLECKNNGRGATEAVNAASSLIIEHGTGDLATFEKMWGEH